jgi:N utilization substance protein B
MALPPQKFREIVLQLLYSKDFAENVPESVPFMMEALKVARGHVRDADLKVELVMSRLPEIDERIQKASTEYSFDRISKVELSILRLGVYELLYQTDVPPKVALAEAIRLCRKFGTPESAHFVNAILDAIRDSYAAQPTNEPLPL